METWADWAIRMIILLMIWVLEQLYAAGPSAWLITISILLLVASVRLLRGQVYLTGDFIAREIKATKDEIAKAIGAIDHIKVSLEIENILEFLLRDEREKRGYVYVCGNKDCEAYGQKRPWLISGDENLGHRPRVSEHHCHICHMGFEWIRPVPPDRRV